MAYQDLNIGNSIFDGFNDKNGIMICGSEWGFSKEDQKQFESGNELKPNEGIEYTFANKALYWGEVANTWSYDNAIKKWFELWGYPLDSHDLGGDFEKSFVQTNWAYTQGNSLKDSDPNKFLLPEQIDNFMHHVEVLKPKIIIFMGSKVMDYLQNSEVLPKFKAIMGDIVEDRQVIQKESSHTRFKVSFQKFEHCQVIGFPHPSGSRGIAHDYIKLFEPEMKKILNNYIEERGFVK